MIPSTNLAHLHQLFSNIANVEWLLFTMGILAGIAIWIILYNKIIKQFFHSLEKTLKKEVVTLLAQSAVGAAIVYLNVLLVNHGEITRNFALSAVGLTGLLFGLWVFIPAEKPTR